MSVIRVNKGDVENFSLVTTPSRTYTSSSTGGITGSVKVFPRRSNLEKDTDASSTFNDNRSTAVVEDNFDLKFKTIYDDVSVKRSTGQSAVGSLEQFLSLVNETQRKKTT